MTDTTGKVAGHEPADTARPTKTAGTAREAGQRPAHIAVLTIPATGHTLPVLDVVTELRRRGHRVTHLTSPAFADIAAQTGAQVVTYQSTLVARPAGPAPAGDFAMWLPFVLVAEANAVLPQVLQALHDDVPDLLLYDRAAYPTGRALAQLWRRPAIALFASFAQGPAWSLAKATNQRSVLDPAHPAYAPLEELLDDFGRQWDIDRIDLRDLSLGREQRSIAFIPRRFQWNGDAFGPDYQFVGPCIASRLAVQDRLKPKSLFPPGNLVYVSLGTTATDPSALHGLVQAVADAAPGRRLLVSTGGLPVDAIGPLPAQVTVRTHVDQVAALAAADAFVTHAGMGGVMEALWFAVPMLCVPATTEQETIAARVTELGLGTSLHLWNTAPEGRRGTMQSVSDALHTLFVDTEMPRRLADMATAVQSAGGATAAADAAERAMATQDELQDNATPT